MERKKNREGLYPKARICAGENEIKTNYLSKKSG